MADVTVNTFLKLKLINQSRVGRNLIINLLSDALGIQHNITKAKEKIHISLPTALAIMTL